jgi:hypothetical protein
VSRTWSDEFGSYVLDGVDVYGFENLLDEVGIIATKYCTVCKASERSAGGLPAELGHKTMHLLSAYNFDAFTGYTYKRY